MLFKNKILRKTIITTIIIFVLYPLVITVKIPNNESTVEKKYSENKVLFNKNDLYQDNINILLETNFNYGYSQVIGDERLSFLDTNNYIENSIRRLINNDIIINSNSIKFFTRPSYVKNIQNQLDDKKNKPAKSFIAKPIISTVDNNNFLKELKKSLYLIVSKQSIEGLSITKLRLVSYSKNIYFLELLQSSGNKKLDDLFTNKLYFYLLTNPYIKRLNEYIMDWQALELFS